MNNEKQIELARLMDFLTSEHLNDEEFCEYHRAVLSHVSAAVKAEKLFLPISLYCQYMGFVELSHKTFRKLQSGKHSVVSSIDLKEVFDCYRRQAEMQYRTLCQLVVSVFQKTIIQEEREVLKKLIDSINEIHKLKHNQ